MAKVFQCGFSGFIYELFKEGDCYRGTKTAVRDGKVCLTKKFESEEEGRGCLTAMSSLDQKFILAYTKLAEKSGDL